MAVATEHTASSAGIPRGATGSRSNGKRPGGVGAAQRAREEQMLQRYAASRDPALREELVTRLMPLARSLALRYRRASEDLDDLLQVANLGLVKAIDGFDPARGRPFAAYAVPTILGELRRHFRDHVWNVHLPRGLQELTLKVDEATTKLTEEQGRAPTVAQIAERLEVSEEDVLEAMRADEARRTLSLDAPRARDDADSGSAIETIGVEDLAFDRVEAGLASERADLDQREWRVLRLRFGSSMTQYEIGQELGVSQMQVSRIMRKALRKLLAAVQGSDGE